jgi:hypothetical protein
VVYDRHLVSSSKETHRKLGAYKAEAACDQNLHGYLLSRVYMTLDTSNKAAVTLQPEQFRV